MSRLRDRILAAERKAAPPAGPLICWHDDAERRAQAAPGQTVIIVGWEDEAFEADATRPDACR